VRDSAESTLATIRRSEFEKAIAPLLARMELCVETVLEDAQTTPSQIDHVVLVGGSTRVPAVKAMLRRMFRKEPVAPVHQDEAVARGAAIYAAILMTRAGTSNLPTPIARKIAQTELQDVTGHAYGTFAVARESGRLENVILIPCNSTVPCEVTKSFYTIRDGQVGVDCTVTEASDNSVVDPEFVASKYAHALDLPPGRPAGREIRVTYSYDRNKVMRCKFLDVESGRRHEVQVEANDLVGMPADDLSDLRIL